MIRFSKSTRRLASWLHDGRVFARVPPILAELSIFWIHRRDAGAAALISSKQLSLNRLKDRLASRHLLRVGRTGRRGGTTEVRSH
jgi:hypothetical protein